MAERSRNSLTSVLEWGGVALLARVFDWLPERLAYALGEAAAGLALVENTARFNQAIEAMIREHPDHWFWVHRRWKTTQPLDPRFEPAMLSSGSRP